MHVILSQKIDTESAYDDELFKVYHYPSRYRNALKEGDTFIYYQGDRYVQEYRYYFGMGTIGKIYTDDEKNYYAELINCRKFENIVPIYFGEDSYIEQLGYVGTRKRPPWQSSIRPLSEEAYSYIVKASGIDLSDNSIHSDTELKDELKAAIRRLFRDNDDNAINDIHDLSAELINVLNKKSSR